MDEETRPHTPEQDRTSRARERACRAPCTLGRTVLIVYGLTFVIVLVAASIVFLLRHLPGG